MILNNKIKGDNCILGASPIAQLVGKESACNARDPVQFLGQEDPLEKG